MTDEVELHRRAQQALIDQMLVHGPGGPPLDCVPTIAELRDSELDEYPIYVRPDVRLDSGDTRIVRLDDPRDVIAIAQQRNEAVHFAEIHTEGPFLLAGKPAVRYTCRRRLQEPGNAALSKSGWQFRGVVAGASDGRLLVAETSAGAGCSPSGN